MAPVPRPRTVGWGLDGIFDPADLYDQTVHEKPMIGGYVSRAPALAMSRLAAEPAIAAIREMQDDKRAPSDGDPAALATDGKSLAERWRIGFVIVKRHPKISYLTGRAFEVERLERITRAVFPVGLWYEDDRVLVYRILGATR